MSDLITISSEALKCTISSKGAEIQSIIRNGKELMWEGNPDVWSGKAPILFPICGGLRDDKYVLNGKEYILPKHGFVRHEEFLVEKQGDSTVTFLLKANEETLKSYPFDFELRVTYTVLGAEITVEYKVTNQSEDTMYYSIGSHEAYACPEGIEEYSVRFDTEENLDASILNGNLLEYKTVKIGDNIRELPLKYEYFAIDALVFLDIKSRKASLMHKGERVVTVEFDGADYFLIWTKPTGKYICLEPWSGIQDFVDSDYDITKKRGILTLAAKETGIKAHKLIF